MIKEVKIDYSKALKFISEDEIISLKSSAKLAMETLINGTGAGNDYIGWVNLPEEYDK